MSARTTSSASRTLTDGPDLAGRLEAGTARAREARRGARPRLALIDPEGGGPLAEALAKHADLQVISRPSLAGLSARWDRVLVRLANTEAHGAALALLRLGGAALLADGHLAAAYERRPQRGRALAAAELGRPVDAAEWAHWRAGTLRPPRLLAEALAAPTLLVHAPSLQRHLAERHGRAAHLVPMPLDPRPAKGEARHVAVRGNHLACAAAIWAAELLAARGLAVTLSTSTPQPELAARLGVTIREAPPSLDLLLAMPGERSHGAALLGAIAAGRPCVASRCLLDAVDAPPWVHPVVDEPSPPLLAEAMVAALAATPPAADPRHSAAVAARAICLALGIGA